MSRHEVDEDYIEKFRYDSLLHAALLTSQVGGQTQPAQAAFGAGGSANLGGVLCAAGYETLSMLYQADGLFATIIDRAAEDALAAGFEFNKNANASVPQEFERLELDEVLVEALRFKRLHGGSIIVPIYEGGGSLGTALYPSRIKNRPIESFEVISIDRLSVHKYNDTTGMPEVYNVTSLVRQGQFKLHASRCIYVLGRKRPWRAVDQSLIWPGVSEGARIVKETLRLTRGFSWAEKALERKSQAVVKMKGLAVQLQQKNQELVTKRLDMLDAVRSILNAVAVDSDDDYNVQDTNLSSISDTLDSQMQAVAAISGYPITVLFGRRTTSLNASGDSDTDTYYRMLDKIRRSDLRGPLREIVALMGNYIDTSVPQGETLVSIAPLKALSEYEESEIEQRRADALLKRAQAVTALMPKAEAPETNAKPPQASGNKAGTQPAPKPVAQPKQPELISPEEARKIIFNEEDEQ